MASTFVVKDEFVTFREFPTRTTLTVMPLGPPFSKNYGDFIGSFSIKSLGICDHIVKRLSNRFGAQLFSWF